MQLLKLVFLCHGWMLGLYGKPLVRDRIEAWKYGPVIPKLYNEVKQYRGGPITRLVSGPRERIDAQQESIIGEVFRVYGDWNGPALSHLTHKANSPWDQVFEDGGWGRRITDPIIKKYYAKLAEGKSQ